MAIRSVSSSSRWAEDARSPEARKSQKVQKCDCDFSKCEGRLSYAYKLNEAVLHRGQGPQGRVQVEQPKVYTIVHKCPLRQMDV